MYARGPLYVLRSDAYYTQLTAGKDLVGKNRLGVTFQIDG
jgi:hypothetical protein